ncbi:DUF2103 domain-containing protein [Candidatus Wolfebacteria bacterium]|nr:DUF2103 domain-containing protein [Candidatus Wolfebacteria bacterium]
MGGQPHRKGGKFGGRHSTLTDAAAKVADLVVTRPEVTNVTIGGINARVSGSSQPRVKISDMSGGIRLAVIGNGGAQEIRVFSGDVQRTKLAVARAVRNLSIKICFG